MIGADGDARKALSALELAALTTVPDASGRIVIDLTAEPAHTVGTRVFHQKFGYGAVVDVEGEKLTIEFEKAGVKRVLAGYVTSEADVPF